MSDGFSVKVEGAERLRELAAALERVDDNDLRKELLRGLRKAAKPMAKVAEDSARANLPKAGGLNEFVASSKFAIRSRVSPKGASIRVVGTKRGHELVRMNRGQLRHPVFGHMDRWVGQSITPGWWEEAHDGKADEVREALGEVLDDIAAKIDRSV